MVELSCGIKVSVGDERKKVTDRIIAEGIVTKVHKQEGVTYLYLNTGYYLVIWPTIKEEKRR